VFLEEKAHLLYGPGYLIPCAGNHMKEKSCVSTESFFNFVDRFTVLRFTATGALLAARRIRILPMKQHA
jgi:hypothetical protein